MEGAEPRRVGRVEEVGGPPDPCYQCRQHAGLRVGRGERGGGGQAGERLARGPVRVRPRQALGLAVRRRPS